MRFEDPGGGFGGLEGLTSSSSKVDLLTIYRRKLSTILSDLEGFTWCPNSGFTVGFVWEMHFGGGLGRSHYGIKFGLSLHKRTLDECCNLEVTCAHKSFER